MRTKMSERTSPTDALERLSWQLNYHQSETISLNQISDSTDLSWATVRKYVQAIETQQKIAPEIALDDEGVEVGRRPSLIDELFKDKAEALAVYILTRARDEGDATAPIERDAHQSVFERYDAALEQLQDRGCVEEADGRIKLTSKGVRIAGPRSGEIAGADRNVTTTRPREICRSSDGNKIIITHPDDIDADQPARNADEWRRSQTTRDQSEPKSYTDDDTSRVYDASEGRKAAATN